MSKLVAAMLLGGSMVLASSAAFAHDPDVIKETTHVITHKGKKITVHVTTQKDGSVTAHVALRDFEKLTGNRKLGHQHEGEGQPGSP